RRCLREKIPLLPGVIFSALITIVAQRRAALQPLSNISVQDRLANCLIAHARYLAHFFYPVRLIPFYPFPFGSVSGAAAAVALLLLTAITLAAWQARRSRPYL